MSQEPFADGWEERDQGWGFEHSAAEGIGQCDGAGADGLDKSWNSEDGFGAEFERIAEGFIDPADDHIDLLKSLQRLQVDSSVPDGEIGSLDEGEAEVPSQKGMFEVRFVIGAGG